MKLRERTSDEFNWVIADWVTQNCVLKIRDETTIDDTGFSEEASKDAKEPKYFFFVDIKRDEDAPKPFQDSLEVKTFFKHNKKSINSLSKNRGTGWKVLDVDDVKWDGKVWKVYFIVQFDKNFDYESKKYKESLYVKNFIKNYNLRNFNV